MKVYLYLSEESRATPHGKWPLSVANSASNDEQASESGKIRVFTGAAVDF